MLSQTAIREFQKCVWDFYATHQRIMPWRQPGDDGQYDAYRIWLSEIMLQQTQVTRVIPKYQAFLNSFPDVDHLAQVPLAAVLQAWSGLGYNRRAKFLHLAARQIVAEFDGEFPRTTEALVRLPGVGVNTAGAIMAYAYNQPVTFVETNIRSVLICHFFNNKDRVTEAELRQAAEAVLDAGRPREWYWALMDYGTHLKATAGNHAQRAAVYAQQSKFQGSVRQLRGQVLRILLDKPATVSQLKSTVQDERLGQVLDRLVAEELVTWSDGQYQLPV